MSKSGYKKSVYQIMQTSPRANNVGFNEVCSRKAKKYYSGMNNQNNALEDRHIKFLNDVCEKMNIAQQRKQYKTMLKERIKPSLANDNKGKNTGLVTHLKMLFTHMFGKKAV